MTNAHKSWRLVRRISWLPSLIMLALAVAGVFAIYSATYRGEDEANSLLDCLKTMLGLTATAGQAQALPFYFLQILWIGLGLCGFVAATLSDYRQIGKWTWVLYGVCVVLLVVVLVMGVQRYGARSWLGIKGLGIQPSEFAKIGLAFALAYYLSNPDRDLRSFKTLATCLVMLGGTVCLILLQPDLGSAAVLMPMTAAILFVAGVPLRYFVAAFIAAAIVGGVLYMNMRRYEAAAHHLRETSPNQTAYARQMENLGRAYMLRPYQWERLLVFLNPERDPYGWGWNLRQSLIAVGSGGFKGKGWLQGTQNVLGFLPRQVAPNDFIFSVIAEEGGFVSCLLVLVGFTVLLLHGFWTALSAPDRLGRLLATGITVMLFCHVFVNMGMTVGLVPITGLPLPLLSYGGSFVMSTMIALGILQSIQAHRKAY